MTKKMTRREALKTLGLAIGTVTASVSSVSGLTSCKEEKKRLIFYFTATGNSLFVARELGGKDIISIPQALKKGELEYEADEIGIVYPVYGHMPPNLVKDFLKVAKLKSGLFLCSVDLRKQPGCIPRSLG